MRGNDVPEENSVLEPELGEHAVNHRRCRLCRPAARELPLGGEGNPGNACAAVARRLADDEDRGVGALLEVCGEPLSQKRRT
jgi:hypothetical protein